MIPTTTTPYAAVKTHNDPAGITLKSLWNSNFVPYHGELPAFWASAEVWIEKASGGTFAPRGVKYILIDPPKMPQSFLARLGDHENLWYRPHPTAPGASKVVPLNASRVTNTPDKIIIAHPYLISYAGPNGIDYRSSWGSKLIHFDSKTLPEPWCRGETWVEIAATGKLAPATMSEVLIDDLSSPQKVLARLNGYNNLWVRPASGPYVPAPGTPRRSLRVPRSQPDNANGLTSGTSTTGNVNPSSGVNTTNSVVTATHTHEADVGIAQSLDSLHLGSTRHLVPSVTRGTLIGPYIVCGGGSGDINDVKLADVFKTGDPAVIIKVTVKQGKAGVRIMKETITGSLNFSLKEECIETYHDGTHGQCRFKVCWEEGGKARGAPEGYEMRQRGDDEKLKLVFAASFPGSEVSSGGEARL